MCALLLLAVAAKVQANAASLRPADYHQIAGWEQMDHAAALQAFRRSCGKTKPSTSPIAEHVNLAEKQRACAEALRWRESARRFFESYFTPHRWYPANQSQRGLLTGYYIPLLQASLVPTEVYRYPLYRVPDDFRTPYLTRAEIESGALAGRGLEIAWLRDPVMRFFLHVQGSGTLQLPDGRLMTAQYAAKNERPYTAIGRVLLDEQVLEPGKVSLQTIRDYLYAQSEARQMEVMNHNASYVFFSLERNGEMPKGSLGVPLTPRHSLAIDPAHVPYGLPVWLDFPDGKPDHFLITQDTGSAIKGAHRGDIFYGLGEPAERQAGAMAEPADWYVFLPKER